MMTLPRHAPPVLLFSIQDNLSVFGLRSIHEYLLAHGCDSRLLYLPQFATTYPDRLEGLREFIARLNPGVFGISLMSVEYENACRLSRFLKQAFPETPVVWGGIHPTLAPETCFPLADYVCRGEGEQTMLAFARALETGAAPHPIKNLCFREGETRRENELYPLLDNLDALAPAGQIPDQAYVQQATGELVRLDRGVFRTRARYQGKMYELISSRGCAFSCTYCCNNALKALYGTSTLRRRSVGSIIRELEQALADNPELASVHFQDDSFMSSPPEYLQSFCAAYREKIGKPLILHAIPRHVDSEKMRWLQRAGLAWLNLGLQSGSDRVCRGLYRRPSVKEDFIRAATLVERFKVAGKYDIIVDNPLESEAERIETISALLDTPRPFLAEFYSLAFYPGTELHARAAREAPHALEDCRRKDYLRYQRTTLNTIAKLAVCLPPRRVRSLLARYQSDPSGARLRARLGLAVLLRCLWYQPLTYVRVLQRAHGNSLLCALRNIGMYLGPALKKKL